MDVREHLRIRTARRHDAIVAWVGLADELLIGILAIAAHDDP
jgi:hypothetical protein